MQWCWPYNDHSRAHLTSADHIMTIHALNSVVMTIQWPLTRSSQWCWSYHDRPFVHFDDHTMTIHTPVLVILTIRPYYVWPWPSTCSFYILYFRLCVPVMKSQQDEHNNHITTPWSQTANTMATHEHMAKNPMAGHQSANKFTPLSTQMSNKDTPPPQSLADNKIAPLRSTRTPRI